MINLENVTVKYGRKTILNDFSLQIPNNQRSLGILGPNGTGKTTLLNVILKKLNTFKGNRKIIGSIAYMPDRNFLYESMKVKQAVKLFDDVYDDFDKNKAFKMLEHFKIDLNLRLHDASKGMHEQIHYSLVLSRNTDFYILDEPLGAVDPIQRDYLLTALKKFRNPDSTLVVVTHLIRDLNDLFDDILILNNGKIAFSESVDNINSKYKNLDDLYREVLEK